MPLTGGATTNALNQNGRFRPLMIIVAAVAAAAGSIVGPAAAGAPSGPCPNWVPNVHWARAEISDG